jgi:hypothetical protein
MSVRGVRNNNPGNIRKGDPWFGLTGIDDGGYCTFEKPEHGIRAIAKVLQSYQSKHGLTTIRQMIYRWAPPADSNDTESYIDDVCAEIHASPTSPYVLTPGRMFPLVKAIIRHEGCGGVYTDDLIRHSVDLAFQVT